jgi:hypothetical protein
MKQNRKAEQNDDVEQERVGGRAQVGLPVGVPDRVSGRVAVRRSGLDSGPAFKIGGAHANAV